MTPPPRSSDDRPLTARDLDALRVELAGIASRIEYLTKAHEAAQAERDNLQKIVTTFLIRFEPALQWAEALRVGDGDERLSLDRRFDRLEARADENRRRINYLIAGATAIGGTLATVAGLLLDGVRGWINRW